MKSEQIFDIWEGEYRVFFNFFRNRNKLTLGFPKRDSYLNDVYYAINQVEQNRLTFSQARSLLTQGMILMLSPQVKGLPPVSITPKIQARGYGYCNSCGKKLSGNKSKPLCYSCWSASKGR